MSDIIIPDKLSSFVPSLEPKSEEEVKAWEQKQADIEREQFYANNSNVGKRYKDKTLSDFIIKNDEQREIIEKVKQYIKDVNEGKDRTLWLCGATGTGKTLLGSCICRETKGVYCKTYDIKDDLLENHFSRKSVFKKYTNYRSLVIDEVGRVEQEKDFMFQLLNERYENEVSTVLITNLSKGELKERLGLPLYDRFVSNCISLTFKGDSHRITERSVNI